jgi:hypothetical protein
MKEKANSSTWTIPIDAIHYRKLTSKPFKTNDWNYEIHFLSPKNNSGLISVRDNEGSEIYRGDYSLRENNQSIYIKLMMLNNTTVDIPYGLKDDQKHLTVHMIDAELDNFIDFLPNVIFSPYLQKK